MDEIMIHLVSIVAVCGLVAVSVLFYCALRNIQKDTKSITEQAFNHLNSQNSVDAVNAIGALEYNRKLTENMDDEPPPPMKQGDATIIKDLEHGKEYEVIGGPM